jgi:shikimate dehydrogenase
MFPNADLSPLDLSFFKKLSGVADAVYNPLCTHLICQAKKRGIPAEGGLYMLVAQAVRASEIFMNTTYDDAITEGIYKKILAEKQNIVLIGMPASGKTTVGKRIAEKLGRPFTDTDELVTLASGESIPDIFAKHGEKEFRRRESAAIKQASTLVGNVIATGGGAILRAENVRSLKQNGKIFFMDAKLSRLRATHDRPLSDTEEKLVKLYHERIDLYRATADVTVPEAETAEADRATAEEIPDVPMESGFGANEPVLTQDPLF